MKIRFLIVSVAVALAGCGGGGGGGGGGSSSSVTETPEFPKHLNSHYHGQTGIVPARAVDARQMPIYTDGRHLIVGVDQGRGIGDVPEAGKRGGTTIRHGRLNDGAGTVALTRYLAATVDDPSLRWKSPPVVRFGGDGDREDYERVIRAVQLVNAALPEGVKMRVASDQPSSDPGSGIYIDFQEDFAGDYWGITFNSNTSNTNQINRSRININEQYDEHGDRRATILLAHEILHALGLFGGDGHVPNDLNSIMETGRDSRNKNIYSWEQGIPQPVSLLYPADREAMRIIYTRLRDGGSPTDFGPWASTSWHVLGTGQQTVFGVRSANGYGEPWAYGLKPTSTLAANSSLSGSATWTGTLLGLTPQAAPVAGDAAIGVNLATMRGTADFTGLESWMPGAAPGAAGTGTQWLDGDLGYTISVRGNTFKRTGGDAGTLTGIFTGRQHEGAAGTLERSDLTAAFGAAR